MRQTSIAIVGAGNVGATIAYTLARSQLASCIMLVDVQPDRGEGQSLDLTDSMPLARGGGVVYAVTFAQARHADIIIIAAGVPQLPHQTRLDICQENTRLVAFITEQLQPINPLAYLMVVTNPVDVMTTLFLRTGILPQSRIFGTGTYLDTQRLRVYVGKALHMCSAMVQGFVLGEHGDSQSIPWQYVTIGGIPLECFSLSDDQLYDIERKVVDQAYRIIEKKGATYFGIAACVAELCHALVYGRRIIVPLSWLHDTFQVSLSLPVILGADGIEQTMSLPLSDAQYEQLRESERVIAAYL